MRRIVQRCPTGAVSKAISLIGDRPLWAVASGLFRLRGVWPAWRSRLLAPSMLGRFSSPYCRQIVEAVQDDDFVVVYHNCGPSVTKAVSEVLSVKAAAYHFGNAADRPV